MKTSKRKGKGKERGGKERGGKERGGKERGKGICQGLTFTDCELAILRLSVDHATQKIGKRVVESEEIQRMLQILEGFLRKRRLVCYGGTAINNILPVEDQFYDREAELPDYDVFSPHALTDAKQLADLFAAEGFAEVEAKSGMHHGTYKIYVNFTAIADLTQQEPAMFRLLQKDAIELQGILYAPPNFLRMSMFLELSRPAGDTTRWEKVLKRMTLLNKHFPLKDPHGCSAASFPRPLEEKQDGQHLFNTLRDAFVYQNCVFFGSFALSLYARYMPSFESKLINHAADFDVLSNDPETTVDIVVARLKEAGYVAQVVSHDPIGELIPAHWEIKVGKDTVAFVYRTVACHSYNVLQLKGQHLRVASIDTILSFTLAFLYADKPYYQAFTNRILCMAQFLFEVQQKNRLQQRGLLRRFSITCYGHEDSVEEIRAKKSKKYYELRRNSPEFEGWFLSYEPNSKEEEDSRKRKTRKTRKKSTKWQLNIL
jgi:hypothetical protein